MKMTIERPKLLAALIAAAAIAPAKSSSPILCNALIKGNAAGEIVVEATDNEIAILYKVQATTCGGDFAICITPHSLSGLLKECRSESVEFNIREGAVAITIGEDSFDLPTHDAMEFPEAQEIDAPAAQINAVVLADMIDCTIFAAATEPGRYAINGIFMRIDAATALLELVATDGRRMAYARKTISGPEMTTFSAIIPIKMMREIRKLCDSGDELISLTKLNESKISASCGAVMLTGSLVEGTYPRYEKVIPEDLDKDIQIDPKAMHSAIKRVNFMVSADSEVVDFKFTWSGNGDGGVCAMNASSTDKGRAKVSMPVKYAGPEAAISFRPRYLLDVLRVLENSKEITLSMKSETRPSTIKRGNDFMYVIMPVNK